MDGKQGRDHEPGPWDDAQAPRQCEEKRGVGGVQDHVHQMESRRTPAEKATVQRQTGDDQRAVAGGPDRRPVPEGVRKSGERGPCPAKEQVVDDQVDVVVDEVETQGLEVQGGCQERNSRVGNPAAILHGA